MRYLVCLLVADAARTTECRQPGLTIVLSKNMIRLIYRQFKITSTKHVTNQIEVISKSFPRWNDMVLITKIQGHLILFEKQ